MKNIQQKLFIVLFTFLMYSVAFAQTNVTTSGMSIQGIARDENNSALANFDQLELVFYVYYLNTANSPVDIMTKTANVTTDNFGVFSYVLDIDQQQYNLISNHSAYLKVSQGSVVFSNEKLQAVPYAIHAQNGVPTGSIMPFIGTEAPNGWLLCDGSTFADDTYHANLKALLGSNKTPDLQGLFLRGTGRYDSNHAGPSLNAVQSHSVQNHAHSLQDIPTLGAGDHTHTLSLYLKTVRRGDGTNAVLDDSEGTSSQHGRVFGENAVISSSGDHTHNLQGNTKATGGIETRPINFGVNYIIKI